MPICCLLPNNLLWAQSIGDITLRLIFIGKSVSFIFSNGSKPFARLDPIDFKGLFPTELTEPSGTGETAVIFVFFPD